MAMGSNGLVNISPEMMQNAQSAIDEYQTAVNGLYSRLNETMESLIPGNFSGSAATGFSTFYHTKIEEPIFESSNGAIPKLIEALTQIVDATLKALPGDEGVDEKLSEANTNVGGEE